MLLKPSTLKPTKKRLLPMDLKFSKTLHFYKFYISKFNMFTFNLIDTY